MTSPNPSREVDELIGELRRYSSTEFANEIYQHNQNGERAQALMRQAAAELASLSRSAEWRDIASAYEACAKIADHLGDSDENEMLHNEAVAFTHGYEIGAREIAAAIRASAPPAPDAKGEEADECAWLVENQDGGRPVYWSLILKEWTSNADEAVRFARKQDAEAYIADAGWTEPKAVEHEWVGPPRPRASTPPAPDGKGEEPT